MADIQRIQCKNHQKTSSYRRNSVPTAGCDSYFMDNNWDTKYIVSCC